MHSLRANPWESKLPWAAIIINQTADVRDDHDCGFVCARAVDESTSRGAGTSVIARTPNACGWCGAGRRRGGKPGGARMKRSRPSTPRPNGRAVGAAPLRRNRRHSQNLQRRVVTQQKFFCRSLSVTGRGAIKRPLSRAVTRHATAAPPAARRLAACAIVNANGCGAVRSRAAGRGNGNTRLPAPTAIASPRTPPI